MTGDSQTVPFHNSVYGCSGVQPDKYPCNGGPMFTYVLTNTLCCIASILCRYPDFAPMFKAELFDPDHWADVFKRAGAKCKLIAKMINMLLLTSCRRCSHL